jgi:putative membrane protein
MSLRRYFVPLALVTVAVLPSACAMFRPINPNAEKTPAAEKAPAPDTKATATKSAPTATAPASKSVKEQRSGLNDPGIAAMVLALNNTDISYARLATRPAPIGAERTDVRQFAQRMLTDHSGVNGLVNDLLAKLNVTPVDNAASLDMRDESANRRDAMRELSGFTFDSTYMENEVSYHVKFLATIDSVMIPVARNAELKNLLVAVRPAVAAHLAHAEQVRANVISRR